MGLSANKEGYPYKPARFADTRWRMYIDYSVFDVSQGKLIRKVFSKIPGDSKKEKRTNGKRIAREITNLLAAGYVIGREREQVPSLRGLTVSDAFTLGARVKMDAGRIRTQERYRNFLNIFHLWLGTTPWGHLPIAEFGKAHVYAFMDWLKQERRVGNRTRNNYAEDIRAVLYALREREIIPDNPARGIKMLPTQSRSHVAFTESQQEQLEVWLKENDPRLFQYTRFIYFCFLRPVEILRLRAKHIDLRSRIIMVRSEVAKNRKQQAIVIPKPMVPVLESMSLENLSGETYLFSKKLQPGAVEIVRNRISERHKKALEQSGLYNGELTMYSWKHTGVCNAYRAGMDIKTLQNHLRHHSLSETEIYLRSLGLRMDSSLLDLEW